MLSNNERRDAQLTAFERALSGFIHAIENMCQYERPSGAKFLSALPLGEPSSVVFPRG